MPRNVSGTYSLPLPPVVPNTVIQSAWANTTTDDIAQGITDSLDRNGRGGMIAPFRLVDGSELQPAFAFASETGTGLYKVSPGIMGVSIMGSKVAQWSAASYDLLGDLNLAGNLGVTGDILFAGDILGTIHVTGGIAVDGGISSFDDVSVSENFDGAAGFFATNLSTGAHSYAIFRATNNSAHSFGLAAVGSANTDFPANSDTGVLFSDHSQGISLVSTAGAGVIRFFTGGFNERMRIDNAGWVGIGPSMPLGGAKLDVRGLIRQINDSTIQGIRLLNSTQVNGLTVAVQEPPDNTALISSDTAALTFATAGTERMRIATNGHVGINSAGDTSWWLGIGNTTSTDSEIHIRNAPTGSMGLFTIDQGASGVLAMVHNRSGAGFIGIANGAAGLVTNISPMTFATGTLERMRINATGEIGINGTNNPADSSWVQIFAAAKVPSIAFIKSSIQGWYVGGEKTGASNRFDISANGGPLFTIQPSNGYAGFNNTTGQDQLSLASFGTGAVTEMVVYGPYGSATLANVYVGTMGNGGGKVELNGHTSASTLASWQMVHHSDLFANDLVFRYSPGGASRPSFVYAERFRVNVNGVASITQAGGSFAVAADPGPNPASIPVGAFVYGAFTGTLGAAATGLGLVNLGAGNSISWGGYTGGSTQTINVGTWRNIGAQSVSPAVGLWMRVG